MREAQREFLFTSREIKLHGMKKVKSMKPRRAERVILFEGYPWFKKQDTYMGEHRILQMSFKHKERGYFSAYISLPDWVNSKRVGKYRLILEPVKGGKK